MRSNFTEAKNRALEEPTLVDALTYICIWESERVVHQVREHEQWETCFRICIKEVMEEWQKKEHSS